MINNDNIFSIESYERSEEILGFLLLGTILCGGYAIASKYDEIKLKKFYKEHKEEIDQMTEKIKKMNLLKQWREYITNIINECKKIYNFDSNDRNCINYDYSYNITEEKFIDEIVKRYIKTNNQNIDFCLFLLAEPKKVTEKDLDDISKYNDDKDLNAPMHVYTKEFENKEKSKLENILHKNKHKLYTLDHIRFESNPDEWYEQFKKNGRNQPFNVDIIFTLNLKQLVDENQ